MTDRARIFIDLIVVAALEALVSEEVNSCVVNATRQILFILDMLQCIRLVPSLREDIKGYLTTDGVSNTN